MKIKIRKSVDTEIEIDVELPYYYCHDLTDYNEYAIYGKIEETKTTTIRLSSNYRSENAELTVDSYKSILQSGMGGYFSPKHKSSKEDFNEAKSRFLAFVYDNTK